MLSRAKDCGVFGTGAFLLGRPGTQSALFYKRGWIRTSAVRQDGGARRRRARLRRKSRVRCAGPEHSSSKDRYLQGLRRNHRAVELRRSVRAGGGRDNEAARRAVILLPTAPIRVTKPSGRRRWRQRRARGSPPLAAARTSGASSSDRRGRNQRAATSVSISAWMAWSSP
jgi:hypothetical protein